MIQLFETWIPSSTLPRGGKREECRGKRGKSIFEVAWVVGPVLAGNKTQMIYQKLVKISESDTNSVLDSAS